MEFLDQNMKKQLEQKLSKLENKITIILFLSENDQKSGEVVEGFLKEVQKFSDRIMIEKTIIEKDLEKAKEYGIYAAPGFTIHGKEKRYLSYYGIPIGQEFNSFVLDILDLSKGKPDVSNELIEKIENITQELRIQVFVSSTCPYCPQAAKVAHDMAIISPKIKADVIDSTQFRELAQRYRISSVPTTIINNKLVLEGALGLDVLMLKIEQMLSESSD